MTATTNPHNRNIYLLLLFLAVPRTEVGEPGCQWTARKTGSAPEPRQQTQSVQPGEVELVLRVRLHCRHSMDPDNVSGFTCLYCLMIWSVPLFSVPNYPSVLLSSFLLLFLIFPSPLTLSLPHQVGLVALNIIADVPGDVVSQGEGIPPHLTHYVARQPKEVSRESQGMN